MFQLESATKAKLLDVVVLSQKNRQPDDNPGAKLVVQLSLTNDALVGFDPLLRSFLFTRTAANPDPQGALDGVPAVSDSPNLTSVGSHLGTLKWLPDMTGYTLTVDLGLGGKRSNIELDDCVLSKWRLTPKEGGTVVAKVNIDAPDVAESAFGKLAKLKSREISILLSPPEVVQQEIDPPPAPAKNKAAGKAKDSDPSGSSEPWPFPKDKPTASGDDQVLAAAKEAHGIKDPA